MRLAGLCLAVTCAMLSILWLAANAFGDALERQTTYEMIADALSVPPDREHAVTWLSPVADMARPVTEADEALLGQALEEAWTVLATAQDTGNAAVLSDRFSGVALERATLAVADAQAHGGRMAVLAINARPAFFHKDGSLFQAETEMTVMRYLASGDTLHTHELTRETGVATFLNEANGWRLYSYERHSSKALSNDNAPWSGHTSGLNYYPAHSPWRDFWTDFDISVVEADFTRIRDLGANSVRIFLTQADFLASDPSDALVKLSQLLAAADQNDLSVIPTLFDLKQDFSLSGWAEDAQYLNTVLPVLAQSDAVAFVDIKNEPDLDFAHHGEAKIMAWLTTMTGLIRSYSNHLSLTIGWSKAEDAARLAANLDVITYHDYAPLTDAKDRLAGVRAVANGKPVVITEIGQSSFDMALGFPGSDQKQAKALTDRLEALEDADGVLIWTLYDFPVVDATVVGGSPWVKRLQKAFGLLHPKGDEKPTAQALRNFWTPTSSQKHSMMTGKVPASAL